MTSFSADFVDANEPQLFSILQQMQKAISDLATENQQQQQQRARFEELCASKTELTNHSVGPAEPAATTSMDPAQAMASKIVLPDKFSGSTADDIENWLFLVKRHLRLSRVSPVDAVDVLMLLMLLMC